MTVAVEVVAETLATGSRRIAMQGSSEMVAIDAAGKPKPVDAASSNYT
ncbi:hypothetical protein [Bradyrhizobium sp. UFLA05-112]